METIDIKDVAEYIGCNLTTVRTYLGRSEFSHIDIIRGQLYNMTAKDLFLLKKIFTDVIKRRRNLQNKNNIKNLNK
jgi:hypothetical protein